MRYNKQWACNQIRRRYPEKFGIRKSLQRLKVKRFRRHMLPAATVELCEAHPSMIKAVVAEYYNKWEKPLKPIIREMEDVLCNAPIIKNVKDINDLRTDIIFTRLAYGFLPSEYVGFHFENRSFTERREFVSDIDMKEFGYSVNDITVIQKYLDKGDAYRQMAEYYKRDAVVVSTLHDYKSFLLFVDKHVQFVKKAVISSMGQGVELVNINETGKSKRQYFLELIKKGKFLLEEKVVQNDSLSKINSSSVNTVRCITFKTEKGIVIPYCFFKAGRDGSFVDNAGAGGIVVGVDPATGVCCTDGFTEYGERFEKHPDSKIIFNGLEIPNWSELRTVCIDAAQKINSMNYLSFDLAFTDNGWIMIEVNEVGQFIIPQIVQQRGIKRDLLYYMGQMRKCI